MSVVLASLKAENIWEINILIEWSGLPDLSWEVALYNIQSRVKRVVATRVTCIHVHDKYERELTQNLHSPLHSFRTRNTILTAGGIFQALRDWASSVN